MLDTKTFDNYLSELNPDQSTAIRSVRALIFEHLPALVEVIDSGKWFTGLLTYSTPDGMFAYALGPRSGGYTTLHMMPYYSLAALQERNGEKLKRFSSGKSCIQFKRFADLPVECLHDIFGATEEYFVIAKQMMQDRQKKKRK